MSAYALTPRAQADIFESWCYIAANSEAAADRVEQAIFESLRKLRKPPGADIPVPISHHIRCSSGH